MIACLTTAGCNTTTSLNSYTDPAYIGKYHAKRIVVTSISVPLDEQQTFENSFVKAADKYDVTILRGLQVFPPTRDFSNKDMLAIAKKAGGDSILIMSVDNRDLEETYVPATYHPGTSRTSVTGYGNFATVQTHQSPGYMTGGYSLSTPGMSLSMRLLDLKSKETVWIADGYSGGDSSATFNNLTSDAATSAISELHNSGIIQLKAKKK